MTVLPLFKRCVHAVQHGVLIKREDAKDKEFHFANWFRDRLVETGLPFEVGGRNSYPDFRMVTVADGYELKGLAYPGREATFDSNSQAPTGFHNGRTIHYVFGRYPQKPDGDSFPLLDLVICHGDFLDAQRDYEHENKSVKGFGTYGDIMIRDRKMYVVPTPFRLAVGIAHHHTLIIPANVDPGPGLVLVGELARQECDDIVIGYGFDLRTSELRAERARNPNAGRMHRFRAWRLAEAPGDDVVMRPDVYPARRNPEAWGGDEGVDDQAD